MGRSRGQPLDGAAVPAVSCSRRRASAANPFTLGVASGDPTPDGIVLWTRFAPEPANPGSLGRARRSQWAGASPPTAACATSLPAALPWPARARAFRPRRSGWPGPGRDYFYQFDLRDEESPIGHFRTAPAPHELVRQMRFAFITCQDWPSGYYTAYRDMLRSDLDSCSTLATTRTSTRSAASTRRDPVPRASSGRPWTCGPTACATPSTSSIPTCRRRTRKFPFAVIWDDHEVAERLLGPGAGIGSPSPEFTARRAAAYQAYYEHMPIRSARRPQAGHRAAHLSQVPYGRLAEFTMLDDRQYRTDNPCGDGEALRCDEALKGGYTMLGADQEQWLARGFRAIAARAGTSSRSSCSSPSWSTRCPVPGRAVLERRLGWLPARAQADADRCGPERPRNPVFLTGDWHSTFVNELKVDFKNPASPAVATEFVTPAITTGGDGTPYGPYYSPMIPFNPHIKYLRRRQARVFQGDRDASRDPLDLRFVTSVEDPNGVGYTERSFVVEDGASLSSRCPESRLKTELTWGRERARERATRTERAAQRRARERRERRSVIDARGDRSRTSGCRSRPATRRFGHGSTPSSSAGTRSRGGRRPPSSDQRLPADCCAAR